MMRDDNKDNLAICGILKYNNSTIDGQDPIILDLSNLKQNKLNRTFFSFILIIKIKYAVHSSAGSNLYVTS